MDVDINGINVFGVECKHCGIAHPNGGNVRNADRSGFGFRLEQGINEVGQEHQSKQCRKGTPPFAQPGTQGFQPGTFGFGFVGFGRVGQYFGVILVKNNVKALLLGLAVRNDGCQQVAQLLGFVPVCAGRAADDLQQAYFLGWAEVESPEFKAGEQAC